MTVRLAIFGAILAAMASGCSGVSISNVSGKVQVAGKPLSGGTISFLSEKPGATAVTVQIGGDGTYNIPDLPYGEYFVSIAPAPPGAEGGSAMTNAKIRSEAIDRAGQPMPRDIIDAGPATPTAKPKGPVVPEKYMDAYNTELKCNVNSATQENNVNIP